MFAFSQVDPRTNGQVSRMDVPLNRLFDTAWESGDDSSMQGAIGRIAQMNQAQGEGTLLSSQDAQGKYGLPGLEFKEPVYEEVAKLQNQRKQAEIDRAFYLEHGATSFARQAGVFAVSMLSQLSHPLDFASMFIPVVGEEKLAAQAAVLGRGVMRQRMARGLLFSREGMQAAGVPFSRTVSAVVEGSVQQAITEIPNVIANAQDHTGYGPRDALVNVVAGGAFAGALHAGLQAAGRLLLRTSKETQQAVFRKAMNDFLEGKNLEVSQYVQLDEAAIRDRVQFDPEVARAEGTAATDAEMGNVRQAVLDKYNEDVVASAIRLRGEDNGKDLIESGPFHAAAAEKLEQDGYDPYAENADFGFITDKGRFISREEAATLMGIHHKYADALDFHFGELDKDLHEQYLDLTEKGMSHKEAIQNMRELAYKKREALLEQLPEVKNAIAAERERRIQAFIDQKRKDWDPTKRIDEEMRAEIAKQQKDGRILSDEQIRKFFPERAEQMKPELEADIKNLEKNLEVKGEGEESPVLDKYEKSLLEDADKTLKDPIDQAITCITKTQQ